RRVLSLYRFSRFPPLSCTHWRSIGFTRERQTPYGVPVRHYDDHEPTRLYHHHAPQADGTPQRPALQNHSIDAHPALGPGARPVRGYPRHTKRFPHGRLFPVQHWHLRSWHATLCYHALFKTDRFHEPRIPGGSGASRPSAQWHVWRRLQNPDGDGAANRIW